MPEIKWIDVNGNERINHDENYQMVELYGEDVSLFMRMDSWDIDVACKLIVFGHTEYINDYIECFRNSFNLIESDRADSYMEVIDWFYKLARSAIKIGILKEHDTLASWLAWAQSKGYKIDHLIPAPQVVVDDGAGSPLNIISKEQKQTKLEKQQAAILKVIEANGFRAMSIPDGEKSGVIQQICGKEHSDLFSGVSSFNRAWKKGVGKLWQMEHHDSYARRGNN